jgi:drug/metabolite transporter (DMT)-like permease
MLEPVVGAFAAFLLLGETMTLWQIGGAALVIVAVILVQQGERRPAESLAMPVRPENELL